MDEKRKQEIKNIVQDILNKHNFGSSNVDIIKLSNVLGFAVYTLDDSVPFDGVIIANKKDEPIDKTAFKDSKIIGFKKSIAPNQNRFIVAHELGHFFLHSANSENNIYVYTYHGKNKNEDKEKEEEANFFAANLLVPEESLRKFLNTFKETSSNVFVEEEAANYFKVSTECIRKRLSEVGL